MCEVTTWLSEEDINSTTNNRGAMLTPLDHISQSSRNTFPDCTSEIRLNPVHLTADIASIR